MTRLGSTLSINGETFNDGEDLTIDTLKTEYGGTGNTVYESNRILYTGSATEFDTASNIYANDG
jgi:hypothetical protein